MIVMTRRGVLLGATAMTAAGLWRPIVGQAQTERVNYALITACTAYPNLRPEHALVGPNHDAVLVKEYLTGNAPVKFDAANVKVLADNLDISNGSPTHGNILGSIADIQARAKPGDFVYLHLSGHGSQQPAIDPSTETDGMDEIFLPADVQFWSGDSKLMPNALQDDEIGAALDSLRDKGANVWIVIDACHSGTATRAAEIGQNVMVMRKVEPKDMGVPADVLDKAKAQQATRDVAAAQSTARPQPGFAVNRGKKNSQAAEQPAPPAGKGKLIAFFAAQTVETTPEMPLPVGVEGATSYGLFTYMIFQEMAKNPTQSYRQLGQAILQQYAAGGLQRPTPLFEGELDAPVFGAEPGDRILQWPIVVANGEPTIAAGLLHRLAKGSKLVIVPTAAALNEAAIGAVEVKAAKNLSSLLTTVEAGGKPRMKPEEIPAGAFARLTDVVVDFALIVARPGFDDDGLKHEVAMVHKVLDGIAADAKKKFSIKLVDAGQPADIRLVVMRENAIQGAAASASDQPALWFLSATGDVEPNGKELPPLIQIDPLNPRKLADATSANLQTIFRAVSLARLGGASADRINRVNVEFSIRRVKPNTMEPLRAAEVPVVNPQDEIHVVAKNDSPDNIDVNILYIGSDYSISRIAAERLVPGGEINKGLLYFSDKTFGMERMVAVLTPAPPLSAMEDLKYLEQGGVPPVTREAGAGGQHGLRAMLGEIGAAPATRAALALGGPTSGGAAAEGAVMMFPLRTQPAS